MAHAKLSPSSAERWMACPGSVAENSGARESSPYADEGTCAHYVAEVCLRTGEHPTQMIGRGVGIRVPPHGEEFCCFDFELDHVVDMPPPRYRLVVDADFAAHVNSYVQYVSDVVRATGGELLVEQKLDISWLTTEPKAEGTADAVVLAGSEIHVIDLKFGQGEQVNVVNNKQLMMYGLAALRQFRLVGDFDTVRLTIFQPRVSAAPSEWVVSADELEAFGKQVTSRATLALSVEGENIFSPTEKGCRWCAVKNTAQGCAALADEVQRVIGVDFEDLTNEKSIPPPPLQDTEAIALGEQMNKVALVELWVSSRREALHRSLVSGRAIPGWKLVKGKQGNRAWLDKGDVEKLLRTFKVPKDQREKVDVISPTDAEKLFKKGSISQYQWDKLVACVVRAEGKLTYAPADDPRPAVAPPSSGDDFTDLTGESLVE